MTDNDLTWIAKNVDKWPDGASEVCRVPIDWEPKFNPIGKDHKRFDFIQYSVERKRLGLKVPKPPKTRRELDVEKVLEMFKGDYCEERAKQVINKLMDDDVLQLYGWT